jgi:hypothetical protein
MLAVKQHIVRDKYVIDAVRTVFSILIMQSSLNSNTQVWKCFMLFYINKRIAHSNQRDIHRLYHSSRVFTTDLKICELNGEGRQAQYVLCYIIR